VPTPEKKPTTKTASKTSAKKPAAKKPAAVKAAAPKVAASKAAAPSAAKKTVAKTAAKKAASPKAASSKAASSKAASSKAASPKAAEKRSEKKAAPKKPVVKVEVQIPVERQKAAQAAGNFELVDLPGGLAEPAAAIRIGKNAAGDKPLKLVRTLAGITKLKTGQVIANYGKSEAKWATDFSRRRGGKASFLQILSYSRQIIGIDSDGKVRICLMGHAGQGQSIPLWVRRDDVVLTIQPNDIILRFDDVEIEE